MINTAHGRRLARALAAAIALGCLYAASPLVSHAPAGAYIAAQCDWQRGAGHSASFERTSSHYSGHASCRQGSRGLQVSHAGKGTRDERLGAWTWKAPPGTVLKGIALDSHLHGAGGHAAQLVAGRSDGTADYFGRVENRWRGEYWSGSNGSWFRARLRCYGGADNVCEQTSAPHVWIKRLRFTLEDAVAPRLAIAGPLLAGGERRGSQVLEARVTDAGGGARAVHVTVNGTQAATHGFGCALKSGMGLRPAPCPASATARIPLDTSRPPFREGTNQVEVCAEDLATSGAPNRACADRLIQVANECPGSARRAAGVAASFRGGRAAITVRHGRRPRVTGVLRDARGRAVPGATACVLTRFTTRAARWRRAAILRSDGDGRISWSPRRGGSRVIRLVHRHGSHHAERRLRLRVRAIARLAVRPRRVRNRGLVRFRGSVPGPARAGRIVVLQVRDDGRWRGFRSARTGPRGRFRARYRFRRTTAVTTYEFRALVRAQSGYPYLAGASRRVRVRVG